MGSHIPHPRHQSWEGTGTSTAPDRWIRPNHLTVVNGGGIEATVDVVEPTGAEYVGIRLDRRAENLCVFAERHDFRPGECIALAPRLDCVHLFDAQSGINLRL